MSDAPIVLTGRKVVGGVAEGEALVTRETISGPACCFALDVGLFCAGTVSSPVSSCKAAAYFAFSSGEVNRT